MADERRQARHTGTVAPSHGSVGRPHGPIEPSHGSVSTPHGTRPRSHDSDEHLVLFDGLCGLCDAIVQFLLRHDRRQAFRFAAIQGTTGRAIVQSAGGNPDLPSSFHVVSDYGSPTSQVFTKSRAVLFVASQLGWPWRAAGVFRVVPNVVRDWVYDLIAQSRYRFFGRYEQCVLPAREFQNRFIND